MTVICLLFWMREARTATARGALLPKNPAWMQSTN